MAVFSTALASSEITPVLFRSNSIVMRQRCATLLVARQRSTSQVREMKLYIACVYACTYTCIEPYATYKSLLRGVFRVCTTQNEAFGCLQCICPSLSAWGMCCKRPKAEVLGSYIRGVHQITMIHVIYIYSNRLAQKRHFLPSGVYIYAIYIPPAPVQGNGRHQCTYTKKCTSYAVYCIYMLYIQVRISFSMLITQHAYTFIYVLTQLYSYVWLLELS